ESPCSVLDIDEILSSTLGALYGRATPAIIKQAKEVLTSKYGGEVHTFKSEFLDPVLELLHQVLENFSNQVHQLKTWSMVSNDPCYSLTLYVIEFF
ncbi:hypothetical protein BgiBS90_031465, partial [Biomphalaria glabrata]